MRRAMLQKLRSRHSIDLPAETWGRRRPTLAILGIIAIVFLFVPLLLALISGIYSDGAVQVTRFQGIAAGVGLLLLVLIVGALRGKPGWARK
jgi:hypothetical protein